MKIWFQLMASEHRSPGFISAVQNQLDKVVSPGVEVTVRGTTHGAFADQYRLLFHYDEREIIGLGMQAQASGYDVFALGNSLDPGVIALREVLDIPVVVQMEISTSVACMTGEKFGVVVGQWTSRRALYAKPPVAVLQRAVEMYDIPVLPELIKGVPGEDRG